MPSEELGFGDKLTSEDNLSDRETLEEEQCSSEEEDK